MRILCVFGRHNYGDPSRGAGVEYSQFLPALRNLGHEVEFFESFARDAYAGFDQLNRALLRRVEAGRPDVVFTVLMMAEVWLETIETIRASGVRVVNWSTDDSWKYAQFSRLVAPAFDLFATTCPDAAAWYARDGMRNFHLTQWASASAHLAEPISAADCEYDVTFVGSRYGRRAARIDRLRAAGLRVECFGHGWPNGSLDEDRLRAVVRTSRISLNFSEAGGGAGAQIKARIFEVPGAGGMLVTENAPHLDAYFQPGRDIEVFSDDDQMVAVIRALLADPGRRDSLARAGHARVAREHTYERRFADLLAALQPTEPRCRRGIDWAGFEACAARHRPTLATGMLRALLAAPATLVWGRARGLRAARRLLFELSWRLAGRRTYTAAGLPGRLFYRES